MTDTEILNKVKTSIGITGTYQDDTLLEYIAEVKLFLADAGVPTEIIESTVSAGVITRGVSDLWNYGAGTANLSDYFMQRAFQLKYAKIPHELTELTVKSKPGTTIGTTQITIENAPSEVNYRYAFNVELPEYDEDLSDWIYWDGISEIIAEDGHKICVAQVTSEILARSAGIVIVAANLG